MPTLQQWRSTWARLGVPPLHFIGAAYNDVCDRYRQPHRRYHTLAHLDECFERLEPFLVILKRPAEAVLALWFHDVVYDQKSTSNEAASADLADRYMATAGLSRLSRDRIVSMILATSHISAPASQDAGVVIDVDLSILAAGRQRFDEYERQVREEYDYLDDRSFWTGRSAFLAKLLARPQIYNTFLGKDLFEARARANIARSIDRAESRLAKGKQRAVVAK